MSDFNQHPMKVPQYSPPVQSAPMDYASEIHQERDVRFFLTILLKRKWWILGPFLTIFLLGAIFTFLKTPIYRSVAMLQITPDNPGSLLTAEDKLSKITGSEEVEKFQQTQYKIFQSWSLAQRVLKALNLENHPAFESIRKNPNMTESEIEDAMVASLLGNIEVTPIRNSFLVEVAFQSPDKSLSQKVVNAIADEYMYLCIDRRNESFALVRKWLDKQLQEMAAKVQEAQKKLYKFGQKEGIYALEDKDNIIVQKFVDLNSLLTKAQAEKIAKGAQYQQIKDGGPNAPLIVNHPLVAQLRQQLVAQQAKVSAMQKVFRNDHPDMQAERANLSELKGRLEAEVQRIQESIKADYEAANRTEKLLNESFSAQKELMAKLQDNLTDFQILKRDAQTNEQLYQAILSRVKEANIGSTMVPSNVAVIDSGRLPSIPFKPKTSRNLALAAVLGLMLGVGLALLVEHLDDSIKSLNDLERACRLPSLGMLPIVGARSLRENSQSSMIGRYLPRLQRSNVEEEDLDLIVFKEPKAAYSESIRHVYSSIMLSTSGNPPHTIMVTSPEPKEGKTAFAINLAQAYALNGYEVALIDCDLRKPRIHRIFQMDPIPGVSNYLTGNASLEEILRPTPIPHLTVIPSGAQPPSPPNLLHSEIFKEMLQQLRKRFRHIIIDTPPVLGFSDARFVSALVDGVLLLTKYNFTHKSAGRLAQQLLNQATILGVVLNAVGTFGQTYGSYYYYHYKYYSGYYSDN